MSVALTAEDLSAATAGTTGSINWAGKTGMGSPSLGVQAGRPTLRLLNESGCGLLVRFGIDSDRIPAGGWLDFQLSGQDHLDYTVEYVLPGQPVSLLLAILYAPGERVPPLPTLGNSPIGIGGSVSTSGAGGTDHVLNTNNPPGTSTYSATPNDQSGASVSEYNDGSGTRKILSAGALLTFWNIVRGTATTGKASIQLGDATDTTITTLYGTASAAQSLNQQITSGDNGAGLLYSTVNGRGIALCYKDSGGAVHEVFTINTDGTVSASGAIHGTADNATIASIGQYLAQSSGAGGFEAVDDAPGGNTRLEPTGDRDTILGYRDAGGVFRDGFQINQYGVQMLNSLGIYPGHGGSMQGINHISGSGSATVNHGLTITPLAALVNTANGSNSTTFGSGSYNATSVYIYQYGAQPWTGAVYA